MSTITEVAKHAGVSKATVSRVLSGTTPVKEGTRQRVNAAIAALGFTPNQAARSLASNKTYTIGLVAASINSAYYGPAASGIEAALRDADRHVIIASGRGTAEGERDAVDFLIKRQVDALVLVTDFLTDDELVAINQRCPIFVMNKHFSGDEGQCIAFDNYAGGYEAARYLINQGHSRIATITGPLRKEDAKQRLLGSQAALAEKGLSLVANYEGDFTAQGGMRCMNELLDDGVSCTALLCGNDATAIGAMHVCSTLGVNIPEDLAIMGFDNLDIAKYYAPSLTTINLPLYEMAQSTAKLLLNTIYNTNYPIQTHFMPLVVQRNSA